MDSESAPDVSTDDLRALIRSESDARRRDQVIYDRSIAELKAAQDQTDTRLGRLTSRMLLAAGVVLTVVTILNWLGPILAKRLVDGAIP